MRIVLVRIEAYDGADVSQGFAAFRDMASAEEWLRAGQFKKDVVGRWYNGEIFAKCVEMEVV